MPTNIYNLKLQEPKSDEPIDPFKEMLHKQWEEKEQELMKKDTVYYEDVRFNGEFLILFSIFFVFVLTFTLGLV